jgi:hypothetical protein
MNTPIATRIARGILAAAIVLALSSAGGCGDNSDPTQEASGTALAAAGVVLNPAKLFPPVFGFNPACIFPGTNVDPGWFTTASVGGHLTISGALLPGNNGTFTVTTYYTPSGPGSSVNPGNVRFTIPCTSETFPPSAVVTWEAP